MANESEDATIRRVGDALVHTITASERRRRRWIGAASAAGGAVVLFGAGVLVGGAVSPIPMPQTTVLSIQCFSSTDSAKPWLISGYVDSTQAAKARADAPGVCGHQLELDAALDGLDKAVTKLHAAGAVCGTLTATNGTTWTFRYNAKGKYNPNGTAYGISDGTPVVPLGSDCVSRSVELPGTTAGPMAVCTGGPALLDVYPLGTSNAAAICESKHLAVAGS